MADNEQPDYNLERPIPTNPGTVSYPFTVEHPNGVDTVVLARVTPALDGSGIYYLDFVFEQTGQLANIGIAVYNSLGVRLEPAANLLKSAFGVNTSDCKAAVYGIAADGYYRFSSKAQSYRIAFDMQNRNPHIDYYLPRVGFETVTETYYG